jgi:hypothetical protein
MHFPRSSARVAVTALWLLTRAALASAQGAAQPPPPRPAPSARAPSLLGRWLDLQQASLSIRYREVETSDDVVTSNHIQHQQALRFRVKLDSAARYTINVGALTGEGFWIAWNNSGIGTGERTGYFALKHLFFAGELLKGVEVQAGSMPLWRGEATEIIGYDNDGYILGVRASVRRPARLFFNEVTYTEANLDGAAPPFVFRRLDRIDDLNYRQFGVVKAIGRRTAVSFDVTSHAGVRTLRAGGRVRTPEWRVADSIRVEGYRRVNGANPASGFAVTADKALFKNKLALIGGFGSVDRHHTLNADRFFAGNRWFVGGNVPVSREWTVAGYITRAVHNDFRVPLGMRIDAVAQYNFVPALRRLNIIP